MIVGIGCDIVEHETTKTLKWDSKVSAQTRAFSSKEIEIFGKKKRIEFLSGRFAAKEAVLKCLGTGMEDGIALTDILILQSESGAPKVNLLGKVKTIAEALGINEWHVSITHSTTFSVALVVAEKL